MKEIEIINEMLKKASIPTDKYLEIKVDLLLKLLIDTKAETKAINYNAKITEPDTDREIYRTNFEVILQEIIKQHH